MDIASHRQRFDVFPQGTRGCGDRFLDGWLGGCLRHRFRGRLQTHRWPRAGAAARLPSVPKDPGGAEQQEIRHSGDDGYDDQTERLCQHPGCRMLGDGWGYVGDIHGSYSWEMLGENLTSSAIDPANVGVKWMVVPYLECFANPPRKVKDHSPPHNCSKFRPRLLCFPPLWCSCLIQSTSLSRGVYRDEK